MLFYRTMARATVINRDASKLDNIIMDLVVEDDDLNYTEKNEIANASSLFDIKRYQGIKLLRWNMKLNRPLMANKELIDPDNDNLKPPENDSNDA